MSAGRLYGRHTAQHPAAVIRKYNKSLDPLRAKQTLLRKKLGQTMVSAIKAPSVTLKIRQKSVLWTHRQMNAQTPALVPSYNIITCNNYDLGMKSVYLVFFYDFPSFPYFFKNNHEYRRHHELISKFNVG